jgi:hypothetical protein
MMHFYFISFTDLCGEFLIFTKNKNSNNAVIGFIRSKQFERVLISPEHYASHAALKTITDYFSMIIRKRS